MDTQLNSALNPTTSDLLSQLYTPPQTMAQAQPTTPTPPQTQPQKPEMNLFERALPTIGGIVGGIGGTFISPFAGSVAGATGGAALGKAIQNYLTGQDLGQDVIKEAALGGVGQVGGGVLGRVAAKGAGALGKLAGNTSDNLIQGQFAKGTLDKTTAGTLRNMGITNADKVGDIAPIVTGQNGALSSGVRRGLQEADMGVDLSRLSPTAQALVSENGLQLAPGALKQIDSTVRAALRKSVNPDDITRVQGRGGRDLPSGSDVIDAGALRNVLPENAFKITQEFEALANKAYQNAYDKFGNANPDQLAKYSIFKGLADEARSAAFGGNSPIPVSAANRQQILSDLGQLKDIAPEAYQHYVDQLASVENLQDLRPVQAPIVNANRALQATARADEVTGGSNAKDVISSITPVVGGLTAGPVGVAAGAIPAILSSNTANKLGAATLDKLSDVLTNPTMQRIVKEAGPAAAQTVAHAENFVPGATTMTPTAGMPGAGVPGQEAAQQGMAEAAMNPNTLAFQSGLIGLINPYAASTYAPLVQQTLDPLQKAATAQAALNALEQTYAQAGGGQGLVGGLLARLGGAITGGPSVTYEQQAGNLQDQLTKMGIPVSALPQLTSNQAGAQAGFGNIQAIIDSLGGAPGTLGTLPTGTL